MRMARLVLVFMLATLLGIGLAFGLSWVVGLLSPFFRLPVFLIVCAWWIWTGWKYASAMDRH